MNSKSNKAFASAVVAIAALSVIAAEKPNDKAEVGTYRLKSHGQLIAEIRVVAPGTMQISQFKMTVADGHTTWRADNAAKTITARLLVDGGQPVEFTAEEIELDQVVNIDPKRTVQKP